MLLLWSVDCLPDLLMNWNSVTWHYLCFLTKQASECEQGSVSGPPRTVHRGRPLTAPGVWGLQRGLTLRPRARAWDGAATHPLTSPSISTTPAVPAQLRWGSLGWGFPQVQGVEETPGGVVPLSEQAGGLVLLTVPTRCTWATPGGERAGGAGAVSSAVVGGERGLKRWRRRWRWRRGGGSRRRWRRSRLASRRVNLLPSSLTGRVQTPRARGAAPWVRRLTARRYPNATVQWALPPAVMETTRMELGGGGTSARASHHSSVKPIICTGQSFQGGGAGHGLAGQVQSG